MIVKVFPARCRGSVSAPPSKSMAHRALLCAGLARGDSRLTGITRSQDMEATLDALAALGAQTRLTGEACAVRGAGDALFSRGPVRVDCRESGSTLRFLIPLLALSGAPAALTGRGRLMQRPQSVYEALFAQQGLDFARDGQALTLCGPLRPGDIELDGNVSSQFITGLLLALPLLPGDSRLRIRPPFESRGYVDLTLEMMARFGVRAAFADDLTLNVPGGQRYSPCDCAVEGDYSQAAFFAALGAVQGGVELTNLAPGSRQGDAVILDLVAAMGARAAWEGGAVTFAPAPLRGRAIDVSNCPDLAPILSVLGLYAQGETVLCNAARLRDKESDRIASMETELRRLGAQVWSTRDSLTVRGWGDRPHFPQTVVCGHNDHRVVMSLAIAATLGSAPLVIEGAEAVDKSYPGFFDDLRRVGGRAEVLA